MIRKGNPDSTTGVLFASLVKSANEPSMEEFFILIFFSTKMCIGRVVRWSIQWRRVLSLKRIASKYTVKRSRGMSPFLQLRNVCSYRVSNKIIKDKTEKGSTSSFNWTNDRKHFPSRTIAPMKEALGITSWLWSEWRNLILKSAALRPTVSGFS